MPGFWEFWVQPPYWGMFWGPKNYLHVSIFIFWSSRSVMRGEDGLVEYDWAFTQKPECHCSNGQMGEGKRKEENWNFCRSNRAWTFAETIRPRGVLGLLFIRPSVLVNLEPTLTSCQDSWKGEKGLKNQTRITDICNKLFSGPGITVRSTEVYNVKRKLPW